VFCCGAIGCTSNQLCVFGAPDTTCCLPNTVPIGSTCCGTLPNGCLPGTVCQQYPVGVFSCVAPSDRNTKEQVVPVAW
jgi:hypothetical protein